MIAALLLALQVTAAPAGTEVALDNPREEARAQGLMREIRCVVCENEPVSQSTADMAVEMRRVIRQQVDEGKSNGQIRKFFSDRYGDFVLFRPPMSGMGALLWLFPLVLLVGAGGWMLARAFARRPRGLAPLADDRNDPAA